MSDEQDYKDYQDYLEYQQHINNSNTIKPGLKSFMEYNPSHEQMMEAAKHPVTGMEDPGFQAIGLLSPTSGAASLMELLGKGPRKLGDTLMQKAVGLKKYIPGLGENLANEGLIGTRGMLQNQVTKGLASRGQEIGDLAKSIPGEISNQAVADKIGDLAGRRMTSGGIIPPEESKNIGQILGKAREVLQSPPMSGEAQAEMRAIAGRRARELGAYRTNPSAALKSQLAGAEQAGRSEALKQAYSSAFPEAPNALAEADQAYGALSKAQSGLSQAPSISPYSSAAKLAAPALGGLAGGYEGGTPGAILGTVGGAALASPAAQSALARMLIPAGKAIQSPTAATMLQSSPAALYDLLTKDSK